MPLLSVVVLEGLNEPQLPGVKLTTTPEEAEPFTKPTTDIAEVPKAAMLLGEAVIFVRETLDALVLKFNEEVTLVPLIYEAAVNAAAPEVVKVRGLILTFATPVLSVKAVAAVALPANVATV